MVFNTYGQNVNIKIHEFLSGLVAGENIDSIIKPVVNGQYLSSLNKSKNSSNLKSNQLIKQRLDSIIWQNYSEWSDDSKRLYLYDKNGYLAEESRHRWNDFDNNWRCFSRKEFKNDYNGNIIEYNFFDYMGGLLGDSVFSRSINEYDEKDNVIVHYSFKLNDSNQWVNSTKYEYEYNNVGNMTRSIRYSWDETLTLWNKRTNVEQEFSENGMTKQIYFNWDQTSNEWINDRKWENEFDENGEITKQIYFNWDQTSSQWINDRKNEREYYDNVSFLSIDYQWDETASQWIHHQKREGKYDNDGNLILSSSCRWNKNANQWINSTKYENEYDGNGNKTLIQYYDWDIDSNKWVFDKKHQFDYDDQDNLISDLLFIWHQDLNELIGSEKNTYEYNENRNMSIERSFEWNYDLKSWVDTCISMATYYYTDLGIISNGLTEIEEFIVYPNPFSDYLTFNFDGEDSQITFELFDIQGSKVLSKSISNGDRLNMKSLNYGVYFYQIYYTGKWYSGKLIKN